MLPISELLLTHGSPHCTIMYQLFLHIGETVRHIWVNFCRMWAGVVCELHCTVATWVEESGTTQPQRSSLGKGWGNTCCAYAITEWCFHQRAVIHTCEIKSYSGDACVEWCMNVHGICVCSWVCTWVWVCVCICVNRCTYLWVQLTTSRIPQIQQRGKAAGGQRIARAAQCLLSSALKLQGLGVGGRGWCYPGPTGAKRYRE